MELAESFADCLLDHFTERGLLAKEIKVAEIVEMEEEEGMEAADATDTADTTGGWNAAEDFTALYSAADFSNPYPAATEQDTQDDLMAYNSPPAQMRRPKNVFPKKAEASSGLQIESPDDLGSRRRRLHSPRLLEQPQQVNNAYSIEFVVQVLP